MATETPADRSTGASAGKEHVTAPLVPPFRVYSVHFAHPEAAVSISLRDPTDDSMVGAHPEWCAGDPATKHPERNAPCAYPADQMSDDDPPTVRVVFQRAGWAPPGTPGRRQDADRGSRTYVIGADAVTGPVGVAYTEQKIEFDALGFSKPLTFPLSGPFPREIARHHVTWRWRVEPVDNVPMTDTVGITDHDVYVTWKRPVDPKTWMKLPTPMPLLPPGQPWTRDWVYTPIVEWTCEWAAGQDSEKSICDAIIANCHRSGLRYGVTGNSVRTMLTGKGGMCGGWYQLFQAMAGCHGVEVLRRAFYVNWETCGSSGEEVKWCALVVDSPGVNQPYPTFDPHLYHDADSMPEPDGKTELTQMVQRRYRFWGSPFVKIHDGHCINFLDCREGKFVYDACFLREPIEVDTIPEVNLKSPTLISDVGNFKERYLDRCVTFMLGSLDIGGGEVFRTILPNTYPGRRRYRDDGLDTQIDFLNGVTVRTAGIPRDGEITFYWGD